jgi:hypothetical protein
MEIIIDTSIIEKLSSGGILAYIAVKMADGSNATTAALASLVRCRTGVMSDGLKEVSVIVPELVAPIPKSRKWRCGVVKAGDGVVLQTLESERFRLLVDDLKKYWDVLNPTLPFEVGRKGGSQIRTFLEDHRQWTQADWRRALNHRKTSVLKHGHGTRSQPLWRWISRLDEYAAGPLSKFGDQVGVGDGKAAIREQSNRQVSEAYLDRLHEPR